MALITIPPTRADVLIANTIAEYTGRPPEKAAEVLTWGADEHVLSVLAAIWWVYTRPQGDNRRRQGNHLLSITLVASALPHLLKIVFDQERPDRLTVRGHWNGVPFSGKPLDAFPSGHAVHVGALVSAASILPRRQKAAVWGAGALLVLTRVVLLAHWTSDVVVGLMVGTLVERMLRPVTGYDRASSRIPRSRRVNAGGSKPIPYKETNR